MLHNYPPRKCWCGERHSREQVFDLNVFGRGDLPPDDAARELAQREQRARVVAEQRHQRAADIAAAGGWELLTSEDVDRALQDEPLTDAEIRALLRKDDSS
jgi:hypothetical protein